jgi:hypothetical protein
MISGVFLKKFFGHPTVIRVNPAIEFLKNPRRTVTRGKQKASADFTDGHCLTLKDTALFPGASQRPSGRASAFAKATARQVRLRNTTARQAKVFDDIR